MKNVKQIYFKRTDLNEEARKKSEKEWEKRVEDLQILGKEGYGKKYDAELFEFFNKRNDLDNYRPSPMWTIPIHPKIKYENINIFLARIQDFIKDKDVLTIHYNEQCTECVIAYSEL